MKCEASPRFHIAVRAACMAIVLLKQSWKKNIFPTQWNYWCYAQCSCIGQTHTCLSKEMQAQLLHQCTVGESAFVLGGVINKEEIFKDALFNNSGPISS